jgi:hypothetical protein
MRHRFRVLDRGFCGTFICFLESIEAPAPSAPPPPNQLRGREPLFGPFRARLSGANSENYTPVRPSVRHARLSTARRPRLQKRILRA